MWREQYFVGVNSLHISSTVQSSKINKNGEKWTYVNSGKIGINRGGQLERENIKKAQEMSEKWMKIKGEVKGRITNEQREGKKKTNTNQVFGRELK